MEALKIVGWCVFAAMAYGVIQDQVTARVCVEYFSLGHAPIWGGVQDPTMLAFGWGVRATWWVGLCFGSAAAFLARSGPRPRLSWRKLVRPVLTLMVVAGSAAAVAGIGAYLVIAPEQVLHLFPTALPQNRQRDYAAVFAAHNAAYLIGFVGGLCCCVWVWWQRGHGERQQLSDQRRRLHVERDKLNVEVRRLREELAGGRDDVPS